MRLTVESLRGAGSETLEHEIVDTFKQKIGIKIEAFVVPVGALPQKRKEDGANHRPQVQLNT